MKRKYELKARAHRQSETRQRIVEAAVALHTTVGPARTTISAIADRAGVERHTVYAHFPDERTLFRACSTHWRLQNPRPEVDALLDVEEPAQRLRNALTQMYGWFDSVEPHLALFIRDATQTEAGAEVLAETIGEISRLADGLARGWPRRKRVRAAIGHALEFETWRSLVRRQGLTNTQALDAMMRLVASV